MNEWDQYTKLPRIGRPKPGKMESNSIDKWVEKSLPLLDAPEVLIPEINCSVRDWDGEDPDHKLVRMLIVTPVEYSAAVANMGVAIIYDIANNRVGDKILCERAYYPEPKLKRLMLKRRVPFFSKETRHSAADFDLIVFSSYYHLQFLAIPELLEMAGINPYADERDEDDPIIALAGITAFNAAAVHNLVDAVFIGEGEEMILDLVETLSFEREHGTAKEGIFRRWARDIRGVYIPSFYEEKYDDEGGLLGTFVKEEQKGYAPARVKKAFIDLKKVPPLTKMFVSNSEGQAMSAGSLMIATGCSNCCAFCQGSFISQPYRERELDQIKEGFTELIRETGVHAVTPYSFNLSDHSRVKDIVHFLMSDEDRKVSMSSQRIDYFSPDFAKAAFMSGNRSITLAIENGSQRMRNIISKNLTEGMILEAFRTAFEIGFLKIKIYMIAGLPFEEEEDRLAIIDLMTKIRTIQAEVQGDVPKTAVRVSYTPFTSKNLTPFQWAKTYDCDKETGLPIVERTLDSVVSELSSLGYRFRVGTGTQLSIVNQCISIGDRRMAPVLMAMYRSKDIAYAGGMSVGKDPLEEVQGYIRKTGREFSDFLEEKSEDAIFAWDFINARVTKSSLLRAWKKAKEEQPISMCFDECRNCGACTPETKEYFELRRSGVTEGSRASISDTLVLTKRHTVHRLRLRIRIADRFRYVHGSKLKMRIRRALLRAGLPTRNDVMLASDKIPFRDWIAGIDYAEVGLHTKDLNVAESKIAEALNKEMGDEAVTVTDAYLMSKAATDFRVSVDRIVYEIDIPTKNISTKALKAAFKETMERDSMVIRLKVKGFQRDTWVSVDYEARPHIHSLEAVRIGTHSHCVMVLSDKITPYDLLPNILDVTKRRVLMYVARRVDFVETVAGGEGDMFSDNCVECDSQIESNLFDEPLSGTHCSAHLHLVSC